MSDCNKTTSFRSHTLALLSSELLVSNPSLTKNGADSHCAVTRERYSSLENMGLDSVEIILRAEELFGIDIGDDEAAKVETVGQLYELICFKLHIHPLQSPETSEELPVITHREKVFLFLSRHYVLRY